MILVAQPVDGSTIFRYNNMSKMASGIYRIGRLACNEQAEIKYSCLEYNRIMSEFSGSGLPLSQDGVNEFVDSTNVGTAELWAVLAVEASGCGFLPDRRPKILFERHKFHLMTDGIYDGAYPDISQPTPGGYGMPGAHQYDRLLQALALDRIAALSSTSWGLGQILGLNFHDAGYADVESMVQDMTISEDRQLTAMARLLLSQQLAALLRQQSWDGFAARYNGPKYEENRYGEKLQDFYERYAEEGDPNLRIRAGQILLTYRGFDPGSIDGVLGTNTSNAIRAFQARDSLSQTGYFDEETMAALQA